MTREWIADAPPVWDQNKQRLVGEAADGIFDRRYRAMKPGELAPGEWWRVEEDGQVVGYGWLDLVWGDAEILLVTDPNKRGAGIGTFVLDHLAKEARQRGLNYLYNTVRPSHPGGDALASWLQGRGFTAARDGALVLASSAQPSAAKATSKPS